MSIISSSGGGGSSGYGTQTLSPNTGETPQEMSPSANFAGGEVETITAATHFLNPTGAPSKMQRYVIRLYSPTSQTITWDTAYRGTAAFPLPSASEGGATEYWLFMWNEDDSTWDFISSKGGFL